MADTPLSVPPTLEPPTPERGASEPTSSGPSGVVGAALAELADLLLSTESFQDMLQGVAELAVKVVEPADTCAITLAQYGRVITVGAADTLASQLDEHQYQRDTGPCLQALSTGIVVECVDMTAETRWDDYPTVALGYGIVAVLSTPMIVGGQPVGVLNLYSSHRHAFTDTEKQLASLLAGQAAIAVTAALRHYDEVTLSDQLRQALSSRSVIDQAIGAVMTQQRCSPDDAFATLRTISQHRNIKLRDIATEITRAIAEPAP